MITVKPRCIVLSACLLAIAVSTIPAKALDISVQNDVCLRLTTAPRSDAGAVKDPAAILTAAHIIYVCSRTALVKSAVIENELLKRVEFQQAGLLITKDPNAADLIIEVRRSNFTTAYPYVVVDPRTRLVVASGNVNSLFGSAAGKIAKGFMKQVQKARTPAGAKPKK
ncbi:MAG: hypothetical protein AABO57_18735 [Acidobacteriota bacterium]